jgi:hypothetical protein
LCISYHHQNILHYPSLDFDQNTFSWNAHAKMPRKDMNLHIAISAVLLLFAVFLDFFMSFSMWTQCSLFSKILKYNTCFELSFKF